MPDALTTIFGLLDLRSARCTRFEAGGDWSLRFPEKRAVKFAAVIRGGCWMIHPEHPAFRIEAGDAFLMSQTPAYVLASDPGLTPLDGTKEIDWSVSDTGRYGGDDVVMLAGAYRVDPLHERLLTDALPQLTVFPGTSRAAPGLRRTLEILEIEFCRTGIGSELLRHHLADMLLVQMLRAFSERDTPGALPGGMEHKGLIGALTDPRLGAALNAIHTAPGRKWTVDALARIAGMSRTAFSDTFHSVIGRSPIDYVTRWRMQLADDLIHQGERVATVAEMLGYGSQSAFGAAYKRVRGHAPKATSGR